MLLTICTNLRNLSIKRGYSYKKTMPEALFQRIESEYGDRTSSFPLDFSNKSKPLRSFFKRLMDRNPRVNEAFTDYVTFLQDPTKKEFVETRLAQKTRQILKVSQTKVKIVKCQVTQIQAIYDNMIYGVFFHRQLNLPSDCYSFAVGQQDQQIKYVMKDRISSEDRMRKIQGIKQRYKQENWDRIYLESYEYFTKKQSIKRWIYEVSADLTLQLTTPHGTQIIGREPTRHLMQLQQIKYPYDQSSLYVTDIDYFMKGNPYTLDG